MPSKKDKTPIEPDRVYHIYNRGIDRTKIFYNHNDYMFFICKYQQYVSPHVNTYAFCLIPNHFHILFRTKPGSHLNKIVSEQLRRFFIVHAQRINILNNRDGNLFCKNFKRILVDKEDYFKRLVFYIHHNPVKHKVTESYKEYPYSSYDFYSKGNNNFIDFNGTLSIFGSIQDFKDYHNYLHEEIYIQKLILED